MLSANLRPDGRSQLSGTISLAALQRLLIQYRRARLKRERGFRSGGSRIECCEQQKDAGTDTKAISHTSGSLRPEDLETDSRKTLAFSEIIGPEDDRCARRIAF